MKELAAIGVDLGGTKVEIALVDLKGNVLERIRVPTNVKGGFAAVEQQIIVACEDIRKQAQQSIVGIGIGVAGQIEAKTGVVHFAPNLNWHEVPLQEKVSATLNLPVLVMNDVRAATSGEWYHGAGKNCQDLVCVFIGTGVGGGLVSNGQLLTGCSNTCGEIGHVTIDLNGPPCTCGNWGCLEAWAGGWAIARQGKESAQKYSDSLILKLANDQIDTITGKTVIEAAQQGDQQALAILEKATEALIAGCASFVNAFNPCRLILGGGIIEGVPEMVENIHAGVRKRALKAATKKLEVVQAQLKRDSGVIGAAALVLHQFV